MDNLRVGDVCEIVADLDRIFSDLIGRECTIVGPLDRYEAAFFRGATPLAFPVQLANDPRLVFSRPCELRRKKPPLASWEDCTWRPNRELA